MICKRMEIEFGICVSLSSLIWTLISNQCVYSSSFVFLFNFWIRSIRIPCRTTQHSARLNNKAKTIQTPLTKEIYIHIIYFDGLFRTFGTIGFLVQLCWVPMTVRKCPYSHRTVDVIEMWSLDACDEKMLTIWICYGYATQRDAHSMLFLHPKNLPPFVFVTMNFGFGASFGVTVFVVCELSKLASSRWIFAAKCAKISAFFLLCTIKSPKFGSRTYFIFEILSQFAVSRKFWFFLLSSSPLKNENWKRKKNIPRMDIG